VIGFVLFEVLWVVSGLVLFLLGLRGVFSCIFFVFFL